MRGLVFALCTVLVLGCSKDNPVEPLPNQSLAPDFHLQDVNPNSVTSGQPVSPRDELQRVSAWYFGNAT